MRFEIDRKGSYIVHFPQANHVAEVEALGAAFCAHENALPTGERNPHLALINTTLQQLQACFQQKSSGAALATTSSESLKRLNTRAEALVRQIQKLLSGLYAETPERATEWGFQVRQSGSRAGTVLLPRNRKELVEVLGKYVEREGERLPAERFTVPNLVEVTRVYEDLCASLNQRSTGTTRRKTGVAGAAGISEALSDYLQAAVAYLLVTKFDRKVTPELGLWGFEVVARPGKATKNGDTPPPNKDA